MEQIVTIPDKSAEHILRTIAEIENKKKSLVEFVRATVIALGHDIEKMDLMFNPKDKTIVITEAAKQNTERKVVVEPAGKSMA